MSLPSDKHEFNDIEKDAFYKAIFSRRDVRSEYIDKAIPDHTLLKILEAGHHAPSVGFMQPWNFIIIKSPEIKRQVKESYIRANKLEAKTFEGKKQEDYTGLKLEGILEAPINICITCDESRNADSLLGRSMAPEMSLYSTVCAIQNIWLAARVEGIGVGWVSILEKESLKKTLNLPKNVIPVAYLCMGYVSSFQDEPELAKKDWRQRLNLQDLIYTDQWPEHD